MEAGITAAAEVTEAGAAAAVGVVEATMMAEAEDTVEGRGILHPRHHNTCEDRGGGTCRRP